MPQSLAPHILAPIPCLYNLAVAMDDLHIITTNLAYWVDQILNLKILFTEWTNFTPPPFIVKNRPKLIAEKSYLALKTH
jgi:hypothetical protein